MKPRLECPRCGRLAALRLNGTFVKHGGRCAATGLTPSEAAGLDRDYLRSLAEAARIRRRRGEVERDARSTAARRRRLAAASPTKPAGEAGAVERAGENLGEVGWGTLVGEALRRPSSEDIAAEEGERLLDALTVPLTPAQRLQVAELVLSGVAPVRAEACVRCGVPPDRYVAMTDRVAEVLPDLLAAYGRTA